MKNDGFSEDRQRAADGWRRSEGQRHERFESLDELEEFFKACDALEGPDREPDWEEHLRVINRSRRRGSTDT